MMKHNKKISSNHINAFLNEYSKSLRSLSFYERKYNISRFILKKAILQSDADYCRHLLLKRAILKYENGEKVDDIALSLGISRATFYNLLKKEHKNERKD